MDSRVGDSSFTRMREELRWRSYRIADVGVGRYCAFDSSNDVVIPNAYDGSNSSMGYSVDDSAVEGDTDNVLGEATCDEPVFVRNNERYHSESAVPSAFSFFQEDGTIIRYITDFQFLTPTGEVMVPLDQLGKSCNNLWLLGKLKPVSKEVYPSELYETLHPTVQELSANRESQRVKQQKRSKIVSVRARVVEFFIDNGSQAVHTPYLVVISENDIYYRLDKPLAAYASCFASFQTYFDMNTRISKELQKDVNRRLSDICTEMASSDDNLLTAWGEPMPIPGFMEAMVGNAIEVIYSECLYQHIFQNNHKSATGENGTGRSIRNFVPPASATVSMGEHPIDNGYADLVLVKNANIDSGGNPHPSVPSSRMHGDVKDETYFKHEIGDRITADDSSINAVDGHHGIGRLLYDTLKCMQDYRREFFMDESFVIPEHMTANQLTDKYKGSLHIDEGVSLSVQKHNSTPMPKFEQVKRQVVITEQPAPPPSSSAPATDSAASPEPIEIKSKVSGRVIKRTSKLADSEDILKRPYVEEAKSVPRKTIVEPCQDEALQRKYEMLVNVEKQCNDLVLPDNFDYTSYNTASELSGDDGMMQPLLLLNDCDVELKDARYYPRDIPLRLLKFYGADEILDIYNVCRQLSAHPSGTDPLIPRFTASELEKHILFATSVDSFKPLEPSTYNFESPKCLCNFFSTCKEWFHNMAHANQKVDEFYMSLMRPLMDYTRQEGFEYQLKLVRDSFELTDKKKELHTRDINAGVADVETLNHFLNTNGGCLYKGRFRHISQDSDIQIPYVNGLRWNKRFKRVERLLSSTRTHKYTPIMYEYQDEGILITIDGRLSGVPLDILTKTARRKQEYRVIYPQDVFEVLPTYAKKLQVWYEENTDKAIPPSDLVDKINDRLENASLGTYRIEKVTPAHPKPVLGFGFKEPQELLNMHIALQPEMLTAYTWPFLLRLSMFYGLYKCRRKYYFRLNSVIGGDLAGNIMSSLDEEEDEEEDEEKEEEAAKEEENADGEDLTDQEDCTKNRIPKGAKQGTSHSDEDEDDDVDDEEDEVEGTKVSKRRGWGNNRYCPHYEFEIEWVPDKTRLRQLFQGAVSPEAIKVIMEKLRTGCYYEIEAKDRLLLLKWLGEVLTYHPESKKFIDLRNEEFHYLKSGLARNENPIAGSLVLSDTHGSEADKLLEGYTNPSDENYNILFSSDNAEESAAKPATTDENKNISISKSESGNDEDGGAKNDISSAPEAENEYALNVSQGVSISQGSQAGDVFRKKKPKEILRELAELEERYVQRNFLIGRDRFYNYYYYFGPELGCRIYIQTLPAARFTAQRASIRSKQLAIPSFGPEKFRFDISVYAKRLEEDRIFGIESKRGRYRKGINNENGNVENKHSQSTGYSTDTDAATTQNTTVSTTTGTAVKEEAMQFVKRRRQKGRKPKMIKPRLRRSRDFFDRRPTSIKGVAEHLNYLKTITPRLCWAVIDSPKKVRMFIDRLSPLTVNERNLQNKLLQLEPELIYLSECQEAPVECWKAPTAYGQLLTSLCRGVWSYASNLHDMLECTLLNYEMLNLQDTTKYVEEVKLLNTRLIQFVEDTTKAALGLSCGTFDVILRGIMMIMEIIALYEYIVARYCHWTHWEDVRPMWHREMCSLYAELQDMSNKVADSKDRPSVEPDNCVCKTRNGGTTMSQEERNLLHIIEELGIWFQYMHVFNKERMELFMHYRTAFAPLRIVGEPTELYHHIVSLRKEPLAYFFGGYKEWLCSINQKVGFPSGLYAEMLSEFGVAESGSMEGSLITMIDSLVPVVPTETLEVRIETVWFFNVPRYGHIVRLLLLKVPCEPLDKANAADTPVEGHSSPILQSMSVLIEKNPDRSTDDESVAEKTDSEQMHDHRGQHRFVIYAPLETVEQQANFIIPLNNLQKHVQRRWQPSDKCLFRGRQAKIVNVKYDAADLWNIVTVELNGQEEQGNLWDLTPI